MRHAHLDGAAAIKRAIDSCIWPRQNQISHACWKARTFARFDAEAIRPQIGNSRPALGMVADYGRAEPLNHGDRALHNAGELDGVAQEVEHECARGLVVDLFWCTDLFKRAILQNRNAVSEFKRLLLVMGDEYSRQTRAFMQIAEP